MIFTVRICLVCELVLSWSCSPLLFSVVTSFLLTVLQTLLLVSPVVLLKQSETILFLCWGNKPFTAPEAAQHHKIYVLLFFLAVTNTALLLQMTCYKYQ